MRRSPSPDADRRRSRRGRRMRTSGSVREECRAKRAAALARRALTCALLGGILSVAGAQLAQASRTLKVYDEGRLHYVHSSGNEIIDEGQATGTVPGRVVVHFTYDGSPSVYANFQIYAHAGTISGHAKGTISNPTSTSPSFRGALTLSGGAGRYAHAHGKGELFGVYYRRSYGMTVQTRGGVQY